MNERTNERTYKQMDERKSKNYIPPHTSYVGGITRILRIEGNACLKSQPLDMKKEQKKNTKKKTLYLSNNCSYP